MKKIHFVINPTAGSDEPILSIINDVLRDKDLEWTVSVSRRENEVYLLAKQLRDTADIIAVYGGDGSVVEAARALYGGTTPMAIIPGGTANVMAKELNLPLDSRKAIQLVVEGAYTIQPIDMGLLNDEPFLIRVNMGLLADMVADTSDEMKDRYGQWAYGMTALHEKNREAIAFRLVIDGTEVAASGVALTVTNAGNVGKTGFSFHPDISVNDGLLDVILMDKADIASLVELTGSILLKRDSSVLKHWKAREVVIELPQESRYLCDDSTGSGRLLRLCVRPGALNILVPV